MFEPRIEAEPDWLPLRAAPLAIQAVPSEGKVLAPRLLKRREIEAFLRERLVVGHVVDCKIDFPQAQVALSWRSAFEERENVAPAEIFGLHELAGWYPDGENRSDFEDFLARSHGLWSEMERRFRQALWLRRWTIVARIVSSHAPRFTEISLDRFLSLRILDWAQGMAQDDAGERIYSIHILGAQSEFATIVKKWQRRSARAAPIARMIYRALNGEFPPGFDEHQIENLKINLLANKKIDKNFRAMIRQACFPKEKASTIAHDTIADSLALALEAHNLKLSPAQRKKLGL